jgi:hypothetical protein
MVKHHGDTIGAISIRSPATLPWTAIETGIGDSEGRGSEAVSSGWRAVCDRPEIASIGRGAEVQKKEKACCTACHSIVSCRVSLNRRT